MAPQPPQLRKNFGDRTANHFAVFVTQPFRAIDKLAVQKTHEVRTYTNFTSFRLSCGLRRAKKPRNGGNFLDRMCNCNTVTRDAITITTWSGHPPRHPASVRTCSMWFPVHFRFLAHSLTTFGRWGCGERCHLSHVVGDSVVVLSGMSRQIAPQTRSEALRHTKRVLNARQGMEGAKNAYRGSQEVRRADTPNQGLSGR